MDRRNRRPTDAWSRANNAPRHPNPQKSVGTDSFAPRRSASSASTSAHVEALRRQRAKTATEKGKEEKQAHNQQVNISINLSVPTKLTDTIKKIGNKVTAFLKSIKQLELREIAAHRYFRIGVGTALSLLIVFGVLQLILNRTPARPNNPGKVQGAENTTPEFKAIVPADEKQISQKYDPEKKVVSYSDQLDGVNVTISQQALPDAFKIDPQGSVETMAKKFNATTPVDAGGTTAFIGKSINGPQTIIFQKNGILVFMYSPKELPKEDIATYIKILK